MDITDIPFIFINIFLFIYFFYFTLSLMYVMWTTAQFLLPREVSVLYFHTISYKCDNNDDDKNIPNVHGSCTVPGQEGFTAGD